MKRAINIDNFLIIFFLLLAILQALWTNESSFPPTAARLLMISACFIPLFFKVEYVSFAFVLFSILRGNLSTAYSYLPDINSVGIYILFVLILFIFHYPKISTRLIPLGPIYLFLLFYWFIVDLFNGVFGGSYPTLLFLSLLIGAFCKTRRAFHLMSLGFIFASLILSVYYFCMFDKFLADWGGDGLARSGWKDPNYFSTTLAYGYIISMFYILGYLKSDLLWLKNKFSLYLTPFVILAAIILLASRGTFISVLLSTIILLLCSKVYFKWKLCFILLLIISSSLFFYLGYFDTLFFRLVDEGNMDSGGSRTFIWQNLIAAYQEQGALLRIFGGGDHHHIALINEHVHNELLTILSDYGIVGVCIYLCYLLKVSISALRNKSMVLFIALFFYVLTTLSLSPFSYINSFLYVIWMTNMLILYQNRMGDEENNFIY